MGERDIIPATSLIGNVLHFGLSEQMELYLDELKDYFNQAKDLKQAELRSQV